MVVTKYAYGTATVGEGEQAISYPCVATYKGEGIDLTIIKIGERNVNLSVEKNIGENGVLTHVAKDGETEYTISVYVPNPTISYTASSNQNIIDGAATNGTGKFKFKFGTDVTVSEAEVVISAQATIGDYTYTFAQYTFTVCKNPVISTLITTEKGHLDGNGAEILPINGGDSIKPFDISSQDSYGYVGGVPRLQFVYNNLILSSSYNNKLNSQASRHIMLKEIKNSEGVVQKYTFLLDGVEYTINSDKTKVLWSSGGTDHEEVVNAENKFELGGSAWIIQDTMITSSKQSSITDLNISSKTIETGTVKFKFDGQDVSGSYSYKTVWDYRMNTTLDSHTIMGNYDPENPSELLNYYYLDAGKAYNIIETFGLTKYFSTESLTEIFDLGFADGETADGYEGVKFTADGKSINILGAPEGGMNFKIKFKPYGSAEFKTIGITILPSIEIVVNYRTETIYENDPYAYGLISYNQVKNNKTYQLISNAKGTDFTIRRNGVTADVVEGEYTLEIVEGTDETLNAKIEHSGSSATLTIANPPRLNAKRVVIKISDKYGYYQYLRYVVGAETQVVISSNDITFTTGGTIDWENNQFPISFKKSGEETIQLASFYTAQITDATSENTSDNYGSDSSLKIDTDGNLYGVQLDSIITKYKTNEKQEIESQYIPHQKSIPYDLYKLVAKDANGDNVVLTSFDKYSKVEIYKGNSTTADYTWIKGGSNPTDWPLDDKGALTPIQDVSQYTIKLFSSSSTSSADGIIQFILLEVNKTDNLYYASRENPTDHYTFAYNISIDGTDIVDVDGKTINNIGNAQYGSAQSLNTTLKITIKDSSDNELDYVDIGILLKFGIYPEVKQTVAGQISYDYVGRGDSIQTVLTNKTSNIALKSSQSSFVAPDKKYSTVLGKTPTTSLSGTASKMDSGTLTSYDYDSSTRVLSLKATLNNDNKAELNNILYTSTAKTELASAKLKIGYKEVVLDANNTYVDDVTGITYQVQGNTLYVSKKIDNANTVTINNIKYTVETSGATPTVKYETLYESIFVVWEYESKTYWAQWNYKVVDKFNQVTTGDPLEAQDGNIKVKLDWVSGDYRFNANTLELWKKGEAKPLGTAQWVSELSGNRYEINIETTKDEQAIKGRYKIVLNDGKMAFSFISGTLDEVITSLAFEEETTKNSSWADKITLTGLDGELTSLRVAKNITIRVNGSEPNDKYTISDDLGLLGKTMNVEIVYTNGIGEGTNPVLITLLFNGNEIKVTFEHFDPTKSNQQSA